jgi:structural maintenance of chromosome 4
MEKVQKEITEQEALLHDLRAKELEANKSNRNELQEIMPQITALSVEEAESDEKLTLANDRLERLINSAKDPENELRMAQERAKKLEDELVSSQEKFNEITTRIPQLHQQIRLQDQKRVVIREEETQLVEKISEYQRDIEANRSEATATSSNNIALMSLMSEKQHGRISGIFGRLGDLGGIDERYDVAISTCCPQLENILVDSVETAQKCISFLKDKNLARMTFIALDKQTKQAENLKQKIQTYGFLL